MRCETILDQVLLGTEDEVYQDCSTSCDIPQDTLCKLNVHASRTSSGRRMYVRFRSCVQGDLVNFWPLKILLVTPQ